MPSDLVYAIRHANRILDWHENMSGNELPPAWMWPFDDELDSWFAQVEADRKSKMSGNSDDDDGGSGGGMMQNEYARGRGGRQ